MTPMIMVLETSVKLLHGLEVATIHMTTEQVHLGK